MFGPPSTELPKPSSPYTPGWRFQAQSHAPLAPTPVVRECCISSKNEQEEKEQLSPVERCVKRLPLPGNEGDDTISLEVTGTLKAGDGHNSQVLTVEVLDSTSTSLPRKGTSLVAKISDPLYFEDDEGYLDPFRCIDKYDTHEANAYQALRELQGRGIPIYFGSYTLSLPVDEGRSRAVRMILMEYVSGVTMADAQPGDFSQGDRQTIMKDIVDLESRVYEKNLWLADFALTLNYFLGEYISPLLRWKNPRRKASPFEDWVDWEWVPWLTAEFAHTVTSITPEMRERWADI
ncbi:hypothetical protein BO82DRAFT_283372 [Aspergillus uvarum CBS 121591]|uniref:Protein kinase domain-containing protein n=1 Tax=Aspergillus uvarum CBS 121591 TaxID=1448315 RepID=A0A319CBZ7_9EURO|nr:hypothetical protein BO82DRAFT_283372 [Aspergillus uvarum CBS 121591]PYH81840.1 hypothetical protein BO82DRAFT_283372 [Aspergillus uvarum CBS 121591]